MLQVRTKQQNAFEENAFGKYAERMRSFLTSNYPDQTLGFSEDEWNLLISEQTKRAQSFGIMFEDDIAQFLEYCIEYGSDFGEVEATPWAAQILEDEKLGGTEKLQQINDYELFVNRKNT